MKFFEEAFVFPSSSKEQRRTNTTVFAWLLIEANDFQTKLSSELLQNHLGAETINENSIRTFQKKKFIVYDSSSI